MVDIESIGRTAFLISELRAEEAERVPQLFDDPYARLFSSPGSKAAVQRAHTLGPLFSASLRVRVRWFDDLLQREAGLQVVESVANGELIARLLPDPALHEGAAAEVFNCLLAR